MSSEIVTPEYLLSHGFVQYYSAEETGIFETPFQNKEDWHFMEASHDRNMFVVILSKNYEDEAHRHHQIYVQEDAGCEFCSIPERWWNLPIEYFESIYYGIRGEKPKYIKPNIEDADFEVLPPTEQQLLNS
jgi:hypothetical protein